MFRLASHMIYNDVMHCSVVHDVMSLHYHYNALRYVHSAEPSQIRNRSDALLQGNYQGGGQQIVGGSTEGQVDRGAGRETGRR